MNMNLVKDFYRPRKKFRIFRGEKSDFLKKKNVKNKIKN